jgi:hypothetical protein
MCKTLKHWVIQFSLPHEQRQLLPMKTLLLPTLSEWFLLMLLGLGAQWLEWKIVQRGMGCFLGDNSEGATKDSPSPF